MDTPTATQRRLRDADLQRLRMQAEIDKLNAESRKLRKEESWHPFVAGAAFMGGLIALLKLLINN